MRNLITSVGYTVYCQRETLTDFNDMIKLIRILRLLKICTRISIGIALEVIALEKVSYYYIQIMSEY